MDNQNNHELYQIEENLAKIIINKHFYFSSHNKESEFSQLPGHFQRAINREAEFQVKTLAQTEGFSDILNENDMEKAQILHNAICEYYAHKGNMEEKLHPNNSQNLFNVLLKRDSDAIARNPFEPKGQEEAMHPTSRHAQHFNKRIHERKNKGREFNAARTLQTIYNHVNGNSID